MRVLVTGVNGFIGSQITTALIEAGHSVVGTVRRITTEKRTVPIEYVACDFARDIRQEDWLPRLSAIDAVVNCAGILRERGADTFEAVHVRAPVALFEACATAGIRKVVHISAIGSPEDSEFIASKHRADEKLKNMRLDWVIVRPSIVYSPAGSYGGTSLLRAMAALPYFVFLPGTGKQSIQPISGNDLARLVVKAVESGSADRKIIEAVGPEILTIENYLKAWRRWLGISVTRTIRIPLWLVYPVAWLGEIIGKGPLGLTMYRMLQHGNVGARDSAKTLAATFGFMPVSLEATLRSRPAFVQDSWHARLYFLRPLLRLSLAAVWVVSGLAGFLYSISESAAMLEGAGIPSDAAPSLIYAASTLDVVLGVLLLLRIKLHLTGMLMLISVIVYSVFLGLWLPALWLEPFGGLVKNLVIIPALGIMLALEERR